MTDDLFSRLQASRVVAQGRVRIGGYTAMSRKAPRLIDYRRENQNTEAVFCASPSRLPRVVPIALGSALEAWHFRAHHAAPYFPSMPRFGPVPVPAGPFSPATEPRYGWSRLDSLLPRSPQNSYQRSAVRTKGLPHRSGIQSPLSPLAPIQAYPSNISTPMSGDEEPTLIHQASADAASSNQEPDAVSAQSTDSTPSAGGADNEIPAIRVPTPDPAEAAAEPAEDLDIDAMLREIGWESRGPGNSTSAVDKKGSTRSTGPGKK